VEKDPLVDPHEVLGVRVDADTREIRAAFRRYAREHHPDRGGGGEEFAVGEAAYRQLQAAGDGGPARPAGSNVVFHRRARGWDRVAVPVRRMLARAARRRG
jgi:DnaJ domain